MGITTTVDPRTKKKLLLAEGVVSAVYFNELKEVKNRSTKPGQEWVPTHIISLVVDGVKIGLGMTDKDKVSAKDSDGNWHDVVKGVEVSVAVQEGAPYNGKPQYNAFSKDVMVIDASGAQTQQAAPAKSNDGVNITKTPYKQRDDSPIIAGNARTAAYNYLSFNETEETPVALIKFYAELGHKIRAEYAANNPTFDAFQVGVSVGQALTTAAQQVHLDDTEAFVNEYLTDIVPASLEIVQGLGKAPEAKAKPARKAATKTAKKTPAVDADDPFGDMGDGASNGSVAFDDVDSDIPF